MFRCLRFGVYGVCRLESPAGIEAEAISSGSADPWYNWRNGDSLPPKFASIPGGSSVLFRAVPILILLVSFSGPSWAQNLIVDPGFEQGFVAGCGEGAFIDTWTKAQGNPAVFSEDCAQAAGLPLTFLNQFTLLGSAASGLRFASVKPGPLSQALAAPIVVQSPVAGSLTLSVALADASPSGCLELYGNGSPSLSGAAYLGCVQVSSQQWEQATVPITAYGAFDFDYLIFAANQAHIAIDDVELELSGVGIPSLQTWSMLILSALLVLVGLGHGRRPSFHLRRSS